jgi:flagellar biosynthesis activator protein FlaF
MHARQADVYGKVQRNAMTDREAEAAALMKAAALLKHCQSNWAAADREAVLDKALKFNQRLWTFFQVALTDPENPLPRAIKENVLSLSLFIDKRIFEVMAYPSPDKLDILININTNIAAGLKGSAA